MGLDGKKQEEIISAKNRSLSAETPGPLGL